MIAVISCGKKRVRITREIEADEMTPEFFKGLPPAWYQVIVIHSIPTKDYDDDCNSAFYMFWNGIKLTIRKG